MKNFTVILMMQLLASVAYPMENDVMSSAHVTAQQVRLREKLQNAVHQQLASHEQKLAQRDQALLQASETYVQSRPSPDVHSYSDYASYLTEQNLALQDVKSDLHESSTKQQNSKNYPMLDPHYYQLPEQPPAHTTQSQQNVSNDNSTTQNQQPLRPIVPGQSHDAKKWLSPKVLAGGGVLSLCLIILCKRLYNKQQENQAKLLPSVQDNTESVVDYIVGHLPEK